MSKAILIIVCFVTICIAQIGQIKSKFIIKKTNSYYVVCNSDSSVTDSVNFVGLNYSKIQLDSLLKTMITKVDSLTNK